VPINITFIISVLFKKLFQLPIFGLDNVSDSLRDKLNKSCFLGVTEEPDIQKIINKDVYFKFYRSEVNQLNKL